MEINESFVVGIDSERVWDFFKDVQSVTECMPGAQLTEETTANTYQGLLTVAVGPVRARFSGSAVVERRDEEKTGLIKATGVDKQGGSRAKATITYKVRPDADGTQVQIAADLNLAGPLAQFGRSGLIQEISNKLTAEFVACLEGKLTEGPGGPEQDRPVRSREIKAGRLFFSVVWGRLKRFFRRFGRNR